MKKKGLVLALFSTAILATTSTGVVDQVLGNEIRVEAAEKATVSDAIKVFEYGTVKKDNYSMWRNFNWAKKGNSKDIYNQTILVKYKYEHSNGSTYYSLYNEKDTWLGYINSDAIEMASGKQGMVVKTSKTVRVTNTNYQIHQNFGWKKKNDSKNFKDQDLKVNYLYNHFNGSTYYSLYSKDNTWLGYINKTGVTEVSTNKKPQGEAIKVDKYATLVNGNYNLYQNFNWKIKEQGEAYKMQTKRVKYEYHHENGSTYYSMYDNQDNWLGYINKNATEENGPKGKSLPRDSYVSLKNSEATVYKDLDTLENPFVLKGNREAEAFFINEAFYHFNGETYYGLYNTKKGVFSKIGYVSEKDLIVDVSSSGKGYAVSRQVKLSTPNQKTYQNFNWKVKHQTKDLMNKVFTAKRVYSHSNGDDYYSLFDEKGTWYGYVNTAFVKGVVPSLTGVKDQTVYMSDKEFDALAGVEATDYLGKKLEIKVTGSVDMKKAGTYELVYTTVDGDGNKAESKSKVTVVDDHAPIFKGIKNETIKQSPVAFDVKKDVTATDFEGKTIDYKVTGEVNTKKAGKYELTYEATDSRKHTTKETKTVTVDKVAEPKLTEIKDIEVKKSAKTFDALKDIEATDYNNKKLEVKVTGTVDMSKSGVYELTYTATDDVDQVVSAKRKVTVINDIKPTFTGVENSKQNITVGSFNPKVGVTAVDSDGNVIDYTVTGEVKADQLGTYELVYQAKDKAGNQVEVKRSVEIFEVQVASVIVTGMNKEKAGRTMRMSADVQPADAKDKSVVWTSSNELVATVDQTGQVTTVSEGVVTITATASNGVAGSKDIVVSNDISGNLRINSSAIMNGIVKSFGFVFVNYENETLYVKEVEIGEVGSRSSKYTEQELAQNGINTTISSRNQLNMSLNSKFGWFEDKLIVKVKVATEDGIEKVFETRL
ncbi:immunoglobulin-like domain-containing protein [Vagococcus hydrophili]|uniref:DUF5011 domain-containing protein n=1 Tax=Vagococcus hydrophili TaxID=2714947 RepID=A0A6G8AQX6_9ENTE|nr:immunoglobulin-like domain-containing protein [Vagococcus hydrophili]QIL47397.1 DUF5011 domain-containing protein [Vagococcus hydrophili]